MDENAALDALAGDNSGEQAASQNSAPSEGQQGATAEPDSKFTNIDPSTLSPDLQTIYKSMQGDYVRKTQEASRLREEAQQAVEFSQRLAYDPNFQQEMYVNLRQYLEQNGMLPGEAHAAAAAETGLNNEADDWDDDDYEDPRVTELHREVQQLKQSAQTQEQQQKYNTIISRLNTEEAQVRASNPNYGDEDIEDIYRIAHATDANLGQAAQIYQQIAERTMNRYLGQKSSVNATTPGVPNVTQHGEQPQQFKDLDDPNLEKAAAAMLMANLAD